MGFRLNIFVVVEGKLKEGKVCWLFKLKLLIDIILF